MSDVLTDTLTEERQEEIVFPATLPVLPLKDTVVFPEAVTPLAIGQERSIKLVEDVVSGDRLLALVTVKDSEADQPGWDDLNEVGTAAVIHKMIKVPDGTLRILVQGLKRSKLDRQVQTDPYLVGEFVELPDEVPETPEVEALTRNVQNLFARVIGLVPYLPEEPHWPRQQKPPCLDRTCSSSRCGPHPPSDGRWSGSRHRSWQNRPSRQNHSADIRGEPTSCCPTAGLRHPHPQRRRTASSDSSLRLQLVVAGLVLQTARTGSKRGRRWRRAARRATRDTRAGHAPTRAGRIYRSARRSY